MAKITTKQRSALPATKFALPAERKYPLDTHNRQVNALARASEMANKGTISRGTEAKIDAAAHKALRKK